MGRRKVAEINWTYPRMLDSAIESEVCNYGWGLYQISRKFGDNETLLYIGLTYEQNFIHRILSHQVNWFNNYRGKKLIRFGKVIKPRGASKEAVHDIESCLIYEVQPKHNQRKTLSYCCSDEYVLSNTGNRGELPKIIRMHDQ